MFAFEKSYKKLTVLENGDENDFSFLFFKLWLNPVENDHEPPLKTVLEHFDIGEDGIRLKYDDCEYVRDNTASGYKL